MQFLPVRIGTLRPHARIDFDVFLLIADKYICYIRSEETFDGDRLSRLKSKGVKKVFIPFDSESGYLAYLDAGLASLTSASIPIEARTAMARDTMGGEAENIQHSLESEQSFHAAESRLGRLVDFLISDKTALKSIVEFSGCSADDTQHSASVAFLTLGLAIRIGGFSSRELFDLSVASLLHDIGKQKAGKKIREHPQAAVDILAEKRFVTPSVLRLIADHEECGSGDGYPGKKNLRKLPLTSQVLNLCNHFDRVSMTKGVPHVALLRDYFQEYAHLFDLQHITLLGEVLSGK